MARQLVGTVHLHTDSGDVVYRPGDQVPAKHAKLITNPKAWAAEVEAEAVVAEPDDSAQQD